MKKTLIIFIRYYLLLTLIFTPYYLYRISIFKTSPCFGVFLKLNEYNMKIRMVNKIDRLILKDINDNNHGQFLVKLIDYLYIIFYKNKPHLTIRKSYNVEFRFSIFLKDNNKYYSYYDEVICKCNTKSNNYILISIIPPLKKLVEYINDTENIKINIFQSYLIKLKYIINLTLPFVIFSSIYKNFLIYQIPQFHLLF
ncbi:MAG: hypothetical protein ACPLW7_06935 [Minisyncoccia bacterium]